MGVPVVSRKNLDESINDYVRKSNRNAPLVTGWVVVASLAPPSGNTGTVDTYVTITSDGLPIHSQLGMLEVSIADTKNMGFISLMSQFLGRNDAG